MLTEKDLTGLRFLVKYRKFIIFFLGIMSLLMIFAGGFSLREARIFAEAGNSSLWKLAPGNQSNFKIDSDYPGALLHAQKSWFMAFLHFLMGFQLIVCSALFAFLPNRNKQLLEFIETHMGNK